MTNYLQNLKFVVALNILTINVINHKKFKYRCSLTVTQLKKLQLSQGLKSQLIKWTTQTQRKNK
jgi:hypothetical protein